MINRMTDYLPAQKSPSSRQASEKLSRSSANVREWMEPAEDLIRKYPAAALASAFVIGVAIAWWIKRT